MIVFRRSSFIPGDRDDMRTLDRFQSLRSPTIVSVSANDRCDRNDRGDHMRTSLNKSVTYVKQEASVAEWLRALVL